jgi:hypothetical protein
VMDQRMKDVFSAPPGMIIPDFVKYKKFSF